MNTLGRWLIGLGTGLALLGTLLYFFGDKLTWLGRLPGDIRWEKGNVRFYFPFTTLVLVNILLYLLLRLYSWLK